MFTNPQEMARVSPASNPLSEDNEPTNYSTTRHSAEDEDHSDYDNDHHSEEEEELSEDSYVGSDIDESTLVLELSTPTIMRTTHFNLENLEDNYILPQSDFEPELDTPSRRFFKGSNSNRSPTRSLASIFTNPQSQPGSSSSIFLHEGSPSTIAPADMHYALSGSGSPSVYSQSLFGQADTRSQYQGTLFQDYSPMKANDMMDEFLNFSPEKQQAGLSKTLPRTLRKSKSSRLLQEDDEVPPVSAQTPSGQRIFNGHTIRSVKKDSPSPSRISRSNVGNSDINLTFPKIRATPSPDPERSAKRRRSRSKSPVKSDIIRSNNLSPTRENTRQISDDAYTMSKAKMDPTMRQEGRRRRETLEFRQFSREIRDFSAVKLSTLDSIRNKDSKVKPVKEEDEEDDASSTVATVSADSSRPTTSPRKRNTRRRSCSAPPVPPAEPPSADQKPAPPTTADSPSADVAALTARLSQLEVELAITRSKLSTSQTTHENTLAELHSERIARERAEDVIRFMTIESKFMIKAARAARLEQQKQATPYIKKEPVYIKQEEPDDDNRSSNLSPRSIRSTHSADTRSIASRRAPGLSSSASSRPGYAAATKARDPYQRPNTTTGMYGAPARAPQKQAAAAVPRLPTSEVEPTTGQKRVLSATNVNNILNQRPVNNNTVGYSSVSNTLSKSKSRSNLVGGGDTVVKAIKPIKGPGGAIRPIAGVRRIDNGRR